MAKDEWRKEENHQIKKKKKKKKKKIRTLEEKENYQDLGILEMDTIKQAEMKEKITKGYHKAFYPRYERLHVSRKEGGRWLTSIEDNVDKSTQGLED